MVTRYEIKIKSKNPINTVSDFILNVCCDDRSNIWLKKYKQIKKGYKYVFSCILDTETTLSDIVDSLSAKFVITEIDIKSI